MAPRRAKFGSSGSLSFRRWYRCGNNMQWCSWDTLRFPFSLVTLLVPPVRVDDTINTLSINHVPSLDIFPYRWGIYTCPTSFIRPFAGLRYRKLSQVPHLNDFPTPRQPPEHVVGELLHLRCRPSSPHPLPTTPSHPDDCSQ